MYEELITHLRECAVSDEDGCYDCCFIDSNKGNGCKICVAYLAEKAADAIEELQKAVQVVRCKDCIHKPIRYAFGKPDAPWIDEEYGERDYTCPYLCGDDYYNKMPDDNGFCSLGEKNEPPKEDTDA